jgi:ElaB/YqjD/DUF883 family membrane-anchored ribosome-binding protein
MIAAKDHDGQEAHDPEILRAEEALARTREELGRSVLALQQEVTRAFDWREWVRRRPVLAVALAFGVGVLIGRRLHDCHHCGR